MSFQEAFGKNFPTEACQGCEQHDADNRSIMSTSSNFEPFATDDLGKNDVIYHAVLLPPPQNACNCLCLNIAYYSLTYSV